MTLEGLLRHERHHVDIDVAGVEHENLEGSLLAGAVGGKHSLVFTPVLVVDGDGGFAKQLGVLGGPSLQKLYKGDAYLGGGCWLLAVGRQAEESGEIVLLASLHADAVEAVVLQAIAFPAAIVVVFLGTLRVKSHVGGIVGIEGIVHAHLHGS